MRPTNPNVLVLALIGVALASGPASAQFPQPEPTPNDTLTTPVVHPDGRITFRIWAPAADSVAVFGDFMFQGLAEGGTLTRNDEGVWSRTVGPLPPDWYTYTYIVDGVRTADPKSAIIKQGVSTIENMVFVPGDAAAYQAVRDVPHGTVHTEWYPSETLGTIRTMRVYTPPGYDDGERRYPVFYLLHGGGDDDSGWVTIGKANLILDNLIADGMAEPMIVVMPNGSLPPPPDGVPGDQAARWRNLMDRYRNELMNDVMPYVAENFRIVEGPENTAIAGLSMGGAQTLGVAPRNLDTFGYVGIWSMGLGEDSPMTEQFVADNQDFFDAELTNERAELIEISVGEGDFLIDSARNLARMFEEAGIEHEYHETAGGHTWINWRQYLRDFAQRLFR